MRAKKILIIAVIFLIIFLIIIMILYFFGPKEVNVVDEEINLSGECSDDDECGYHGHRECRYLTYEITLEDGKTQYIKKGDSYCVEWCDIGIACTEENTICRQYDYAEGDQILTRSGCVESDGYKSIVEMETIDSWVE